MSIDPRGLPSIGQAMRGCHGPRSWRAFTVGWRLAKGAGKPA
jgi:hypothetical protein